MLFRSGKLTYGSAGTGSANHLAGEMFKQAAGLDMIHVPYKGNGPAIVDLIGGQVSMTFTSMAAVQAFVRNKRLRLLGSHEIPFTEGVARIMRQIVRLQL